MITKKIICPRCNEKMPENSVRCTSCGLIFDRLNYATNSAGKKMIRNGNRDKVVYVKKLPSDVKKWKLILMGVFTGLFGGHCFYVGRYVRGIIMLFGGIIAIVSGVLASFSLLPESIFTLCGMISGVMFIVWLFDVINICFSKFKVPAYIEKTEVKKWKPLLLELVVV